MHFFDMGIGEILLIIIVALIIWGPDKIPEIARTLGKTMRILRKASFDLTAQISKELEGEEKDRSSQPRANSDDKTKKASGVDTAEPGGTETTSPRDQ